MADWLALKFPEATVNSRPSEVYDEVDRPRSPDTTTPTIIYILYLLSLFVGVTAIIGVILAYMYQQRGPEWIDVHYWYQIRTFWIGLLYTAISIVLMPVLIGFVMALFIFVWVIIRCVKGIRALRDRRGPSQPASWLF